MAYIGRQNLGGAYRQLDDISSGFDGSDTTHTMQVNSQNVTVGDVNQIILSLGGVIQKQGTDFTVSGSVLTFTTAPAANTSFFAVLLGSDNGGTITPTDASVTVSKLAIAGGEVKLDADGDTSLTADTDDQIDIKIAGADDIKITANKFELLSGTSLDMDGLSTKVAAGDVIFQGGKTGNTTLTNGTYTQIQFTSESYDRGNNFASNTFTAPKDGVYLFHCQFRPNNFAFDRILLNIYKNDSSIAGTAISNTGEVSNINAGEYPSINATNLLSLAANDTIKMYGYQNTGSDRTIFEATLFVIRVGTFD